jgi:hypothetical protein
LQYWHIKKRWHFLLVEGGQEIEGSKSLLGKEITAIVLGTVMYSYAIAAQQYNREREEV